MNTNNFGVLAAYALTAVGGVGLALAIGFSIYVWYKEAYTEEGFLSDKDKKIWKASYECTQRIGALLHTKNNHKKVTQLGLALFKTMEPDSFFLHSPSFLVFYHHLLPLTQPTPSIRKIL